ncbi:hypothetical protein PG357_10005 [Riemerella anatipestifer]|nr:hypothetical protein [Riemerella anatipestifer]
MSVKGDIYKTIEAHLMDNVEGLAVVDKDRGQLENISEFAMPFPAILMSYGRFEYEPIGGGLKKGTGTIQFRVAYENYADSYSGSINQDLALQFFEFNEQVQNALEGFSSDLFSPLTLIADEDDKDHKNIIVTIFEYETTIVNKSGANDKNYIQVDATPKVRYTQKENLPKREAHNDFIIDI